ncbi:MAG: hypothetical protein H7177_07510 [Rhizobacter sp.]|nr:hypothetical protein [Bacteriovorax sp.]
MKNLTIALVLTLLAGVNIFSAQAKSKEITDEKTVITTDVQDQQHTQASEEFISKIEAAQKEQMIKFVQKNFFLHDTDLI